MLTLSLSQCQRGDKNLKVIAYEYKKYCRNEQISYNLRTIKVEKSVRKREGEMCTVCVCVP